MRSDIDEDDGDDEVEECNYKISELWLMKTRKRYLNILYIFIWGYYTIYAIIYSYSQISLRYL